MEKIELGKAAEYISDKIAVDDVNLEDYISTENMLPNKGGICMASNKPTTGKVTKFRKGDVLTSNIRPYFKKIWIADRDGGCSNDVLVIRSKQGYLSEFIYYVLSENRFFDYSTASSKGTKMPRGDKAAIMQYLVPDFEIDEQRKIIEILKYIDKKIEVNSKLNANLEDSIDILFSEMFKKSDEVSQWETVTLKDFAFDIITGKTPSTKKEEYYGEKYPFITIPDMHGSVFISNTQRCLSEEGNRVQKGKLLPKRTVVVSCIATIGLVAITTQPSHTNQQINAVIPKNDFDTAFIYEVCKNLKSTLLGIGSTGSTTLNVNKGEFEKLTIINPPEELRIEFANIVEPMLSQIRSNDLETLLLRNMRDILLPQLMSGQINLSDISIDA